MGRDQCGGRDGGDEGTVGAPICRSSTDFIFENYFYINFDILGERRGPRTRAHWPLGHGPRPGGEGASENGE